MLINAETIQDENIITADVAIVGAGPAGIVLALELAKAGLEIALLESGQLQFDQESQNLGDEGYVNRQFHAPMSECTRRQVGGTSTIWGGRCVPYDSVDFAQRDYIAHSDWSVTYEELALYFQRASDYCLSGQAEFNLHNLEHILQKSIVPGLPDEEVLTSTLERWCLPTNFGKEYFNQLQKSDRIKLFYGLTCTEIITSEEGNQVKLLQTKTLGGKEINVKCQRYILAGGALNNTRLLMVSDRHHSGGIGNHSGLLGKFYMGHLSGDIAKVKFTTPPEKTIFGFDRDSDNTYIRRRFSFSSEFLIEQQLSNIVGWLGAPEFGDFSHQNGILSSAYIALSLPVLKTRLGAATAIRRAAIGTDKGIYYPHILNIIKDLNKIISFIPSFGYGRFIAKRKIPALFVYSAANEYPLHYHSEQVPNLDSTVSLTNEKDALGMRRLNIDLRFTEQDIKSVVQAHHHWDQHLRKHDCGYLEYLTDDLEATVWTQAGDGFHQVGTTRMSAHPDQGVVDTNCSVHGFDDLFVASSSNFVTSGQANSTFMIVAFALRLADYLKQVFEMSQSIDIRNSINQSLKDQKTSWTEKLANLKSPVIPYAKQIRLAPQSFSTIITPVNGKLLGSLYKSFPDGMVGDILLSAFVSYIARISDTASFDIGFTDPEVTLEMIDLAGLFTAYIPCHLDIDLEQDFSSIFQSVQNQIKFDKQDQSHALDLATGEPILNSLPGLGEENMLSVALERVSTLKKSEQTQPFGSNFTLTIPDRGQECRWRFNSEVLTPEDITKMWAQFQTLLYSLVEHPEKSLAQHSILPEAERQLILEGASSSSLLSGVKIHNDVPENY